MNYRDLIIIILLFILFYCKLDYIKKFIKIIKRYFYPIKHLEINSDLSLIKKEQINIIKYIKKNINIDIQNKKLKKIIIYVIEDGKKVRPIIVSSIFKQLNNLNNEINQNNPFPENLNFIYEAAISIEFLHCASLIIDDIMDLDDERRGKVAVYIKYGLSMAQLTALILCSLSMQKIFNSFQKLNTTFPEANKNIPIILGNIVSDMVKNLSLGQYLDITINSNKSKLNIEDLIHKKTSSLFEYCFVIPWVLTYYSKKDEELIIDIENMKTIAKLFGLIFQIADDFEDIEQDLKKQQNSIVNYVINKGSYSAYKDYNKFVIKFTKLSKKYNVLTPELEQIINYLTLKVNLYYKKNAILS